MLIIDAAIIAAFRLAWPEFSDLVKWPDSIVTKALCEGDAETGSDRWGGYEDECHNFKQRGMFLYAAFWLTVMYPAGGDKPPSPTPQYALNSKEVGDESLSYANGVSKSSSTDFSFLASNVYGQQFLRLRKRAGMGAVAV